MAAVNENRLAHDGLDLETAIGSWGVDAISKLSMVSCGELIGRYPSLVFTGEQLQELLQAYGYFQARAESGDPTAASKMQEIRETLDYLDSCKGQLPEISEGDLVTDAEECPWCDLKSMHAYVGPSSDNIHRFRNLSFTDMGYARLWHTIGFYQAQLCSPETEDSAKKHLAELYKQFARLNQYGGYDEELRAPACRVRIGDDGNFASFTVAWYRRVSPKAIESRVEELRKSREKSHAQWAQRRIKAQEIVRNLEKLENRELSKEDYPEHVQKILAEPEPSVQHLHDEVRVDLRVDPELAIWSSSHWKIYYAYFMNGGLIFHRDNSEEGRYRGHWSIHT